MKATIKREYQEHCTIGHFISELFNCVTLELPNLNNQKQISCIPEGVYKCQKIVHPKFGNCFRILQVDSRDGVLIHNGNYTSNTHGCILVGKDFADINKDGIIDITSSVNTLKEMYLKMPNEFELEITQNICDIRF